MARAGVNTDQSHLSAARSVKIVSAHFDRLGLMVYNKRLVRAFETDRQSIRISDPKSSREVN